MNDLREYDLMILEWTCIADNNSGHLLPGAAEFMQADDTPRMFALVTNQGGVGLRYWMQSSRKPWGRPDQLPTEDDVLARFDTTEAELLLIDCVSVRPVYVSFAYQANSGKWSPTPDGKNNDPAWDRDARMPGTKLITRALSDFNVAPDKVILIGSRWPANEAAAVTLGLDYADYDSLQDRPPF